MEMYDGTEGKTNVGKVLLTIFGTILGIIIALLLFLIFMVKSGADISGYYLTTVNQMSDNVLPSGSIVLLKKEPFYEPSAGEPVVYIAEAGNILVRITGIKTSNSEITEITAVAGNETYTFTPSNIRAYAVSYVPYLGGIIDFIVTPIGLICCVAVPLFILLVFEIINLIIVSRRPKKEEDPSYMNLDETAVLKHRSRPAAEVLAAPKRELSYSAEPAAVNPPQMIGMTNITDIIEPVNEPLQMEMPPAKPAEPAEKKVKPFLHETQEFVIPDKTPPVQPAPTQPTDVQPAAETKKSPFSATVASPGSSASNEFVIEGIGIKVEENGIKLKMDRDIQEKDISITISQNSASVLIGTETSELNFAMIKAPGSEKKVIIRRKSKS